MTLTGTVSAAGDIQGTYSDSILGPQEQPVVVTGTFDAKWSAPALVGAADPSPVFDFPAIASPFSGLAYASCTANCPNGDCSGGSFLRSSAAFYNWFSGIANQASADPYSKLDPSSCGGTSCLNTVYLRCAQYQFVNALIAKPGDAEASMGFLDTLEVMADYALLFGNQAIVQATNGWKTMGSVAGERAELDTALGLLRSGNHSDDQSAPLAMFDPFLLRAVLESTSVDAFQNANSNMPTLLGDLGARAPFEHLRRQALVLGALLRAYVEQLDRQHRLGLGDEAMATSVSAANLAYLDLAILGAIELKAGATSALELETSQVAEELAAILGKHDDLVADRNPAGYLDSYVPFLVDNTQLQHTLYSNVYAKASEYLLNYARPAQDKSVSGSQDYEWRGDALKTEYAAQANQFQSELTDVCGPVSSLDDCGKDTGALASAASDAQVAALRVQAAAQRIIDLDSEITIEVERAKQVADTYRATAKLIAADGKVLVDLNTKEIALNSQLDMARMAAQSLGQMTSAPGAFLSLLGLGLEAAVMQSVTQQKTDVEAQRIQIETIEKARASTDQANVETIDSMATVQSKMLEQATDGLELLIAKENLAQAVKSCTALRQKAELYAAQEARFEALKDEDLRHMLQYRVYVDHLGLAAEAAFRALMAWAWQATRAVEYELNASYPKRADLWQTRSAADIDTYLRDLDQYYTNTRQLVPQTWVEVISLRDTLLDLKDKLSDSVTANTYDARDRFRRFVAAPENRDAQGNLTIPFSTYRPDKAIFSSAVCIDRVTSVRLNLVGDNLGTGLTYAFLKLSQGGGTYIRSCSNGGAEIVEYNLGNEPRVARVKAGINAPNHAQAMEANTDLIWRSVLSGSWQLTIDQDPSHEPANANLDLSGLDDIELVIEHQAFTIQ